MRKEMGSLSNNLASYLTLESDAEDLSTSIYNIQTILSNYRSLVNDTFSAVNALVEVLKSPSQYLRPVLNNEAVVIHSFYEKFCKNNFDIENKVKKFNNEEADKFRHLSSLLAELDSFKNIPNGENASEHLKTEVSRLKNECYRQRVYILQLQKEIRDNGFIPSFKFKKEFVDGSITEYHTPKISEVAKKAIDSDVKLNINQCVELTSRQLISAKESGTLDDTSELIYTGILKQMKSQNSRQKSHSRRDFYKNRRLSSQSRLTSRSVYGELNNNEDDNDLISLKSDVSRHKQEIDMLNKEIDLLRKELMLRSKENEVLENIHQSDLSNLQTKSEYAIKGFKKEIEGKERERSDNSMTSDNNVTIERQLKALANMKQVTENLIKEKKVIKDKLTQTISELKSAKSQITALLEKLDKKEKECKELELINQKLSQSYLIAVQRENNMAEKLERLSVKLKVYDKFFKDQNISTGV